MKYEGKWERCKKRLDLFYKLLNNVKYRKKRMNWYYKRYSNK